MSDLSAAQAILARIGDFRPRYGLILGSGLGGVADAIETVAEFPYESLPGFPKLGVSGHAGALKLGRLGGQNVACLQGRKHLYEGIPAASLKTPVRTLKQIGCETLIVTNAAGSLNPEMAPGSVMMIADHINLAGTNPLIGPNDADVGPRFVDMNDAYDPALRARLRAVAEATGETVYEGVYLSVIGPCFETPAEIRAYKTLGADAVGMSTVHEVIVARHCGLSVLGFSCITNLAAGLQSSLSHDETLSEGRRAGAVLGPLLTGFLAGTAKD